MDRILINECIITEKQFEFENAYKDITRLKPFFHDKCNIDFDNYKYYLMIIDDLDIQSSPKPICELYKPKRIISLIKNEPTLLHEIQSSLIICFPELSTIPAVIKQAKANSNTGTMLLLETYKTTTPHLSG